MDIYIIFYSVGSFFIFLLSHCILFRFIDQRRFIYIFSISYILGIIFAISSIFACYDSSHRGVFLACVFIVYSLLVVCYGMCIFAVIDSSLHIQLLREIGTFGLSEKKLFSVFNEKIIVNKRLQWLVEDKVIQLDHNRYKITSNFRLITFREILLQLFGLLFP